MTSRPFIVQWPGASGRWYAHTVFPWDVLPEVENANFILVAVRGKAALPLFIGLSEALTRELPLRPEWSAAQMHGLTHVHVHLLAADARERETIRSDIAARVKTPLNGAARPAGVRAGLIQVTPGEPVRWLGGRQPSHRATQLGLKFILPQAAAVRRAG
ncbi:MAG: hypothetical protein ACHQZQ_02310 [SAR324 cluster bacterium]